MHSDPKSAKKTVKLPKLFARIGSAGVKAEHKMLMKLTSCKDRICIIQ